MRGGAVNKRRQLEMAVIDAAVTWVAAHVDDASDVGDRLIEAVIRYSYYGLAEPRFTRTVHSAPDTSHEAGEWMKQFALTDAAAVFREIYYTWRRSIRRDPDWNDEGMTCDEVEQRLERTHQSMSARVNQLRDSGWVIDSGLRRKTRSGRDAIVWTPTKAALDLVDRVGLPIPVTAPNKEGE